jgi:integrase
MSDRTRSKRFPGVYWRESKSSRHLGKPDRIYWITWHDLQKKKRWFKIGKASEGVNEEYANRKLVELKHQQNLGELPDLLKRRSSPVLNRLANSYFTWMQGEGKHTVPEKSRYRVHVLDALGKTPMDSLNADALNKYKVGLIEKSPATARKVMALLRRIINHGIRQGIWKGVNPISHLGGVSVPSVDDRAERYLTPEEARALLERMEIWSQELHDMALLILRTGLRPTEVFRLNGDDLDVRNSTLYIQEKGGSRQAVWAPPDIIQMLDSYGRGPGEPVFQRPRAGGRFTQTPDSFQTIVDDVGLNDGVVDRRRRVIMHTLRHTFASWLAQSGQVGIYELMKLLRHKRIETTLRYAHLIPDRQREHFAVAKDMLNYP